MATAKQRTDGCWGIQIKVKGIRESGTFPSKREADLWAARRTLEINAQASGKAGDVHSLRDALRRFAEEVSPTHKGEHWERVRLAAMEEQLPSTLPLNKVTTAALNNWKLERLKMVSPATVTREMNLLSSVFTYARREWGWIAASPLSDVRRPKEPNHRERVISWGEIKTMLRELGYTPGKPPTSMKAMVGYAFLIALRTGMRAGEITGMRWAQVHASWVTLPETKNGTSRDVPLPLKARRLMGRLRGLDNESVLLVSSATLDALFRRARVSAGLSGFTFHDSRHTAATRIGRTVGQPGRLTFPQFCKCFGWNDPKHALIYVNPTAAELAELM